MCPVINGQAVDAEVTNPAFLDAQIDDTALGKIGFHNTDVQSGAFIDNIQRCVNRLFDASGVDETTSDGTTYNAPSGTIANADPYEIAFRKIANKFASITGHSHNQSVPGDGGPIVLGSGVTSIAPSGYTPLFGDIVFIPSGGMSISTSGQDIIFTLPQAVTSSDVSSISVSGSIHITGDVVLVPSGGITMSQSGQNITVFSSTSGGGGGGNLTVASVSSTYSILTTDQVVLLNANGAAFTSTLPSAVGVVGKVYYLEKIISDTSVNLATIATTSGQTIGGFSSYTLATAGESLTIVSDNSNWIILDHCCEVPWTAYTMVITSTGSNPTFPSTVINDAKWRRSGDTMYMKYTFKYNSGGSAGTGVYEFNLPTGYLINTSKQGTDSVNMIYRVGDASMSTNGDGVDGISLLGAMYASHNFGMMMVVGSVSGSNLVSTLQQVEGSLYGIGNANIYTFQASVPIAGWMA